MAAFVSFCLKFSIAEGGGILPGSIPAGAGVKKWTARGESERPLFFPGPCFVLA